MSIQQLVVEYIQNPHERQMRNLLKEMDLGIKKIIQDCALNLIPIYIFENEKEDFFNQARMEVVKCLKRYNPEIGSFKAFSYKRIRGVVFDYIRKVSQRNASINITTMDMNDLEYNLTEEEEAISDMFFLEDLNEGKFESGLILHEKYIKFMELTNEFLDEEESIIWELRVRYGLTNKSICSIFYMTEAWGSRYWNAIRNKLQPIFKEVCNADFIDQR